MDIAYINVPDSKCQSIINCMFQHCIFWYVVYMFSPLHTHTYTESKEANRQENIKIVMEVIEDMICDWIMMVIYVS